MASLVVIKDALHTPANPATPTVGVVTADDARLSQAAAWARSAAGVGARTGVVYAGVPLLLAGTATTAPSMQVSVAALHFVAQKAAAEGVYVGASPGVVLLDIAAAPGANSRIDVVYVMQRDAASPTSPDPVTQGEMGVVTGTAAVTPTKPSIPAGAVELGTVTVAAGATATTNAQVTVATTCLWTVPLGAPIPVRNQGERDVITAYKGVTVDRLDLNHLERYDGASWLEPGAAGVAAHKPLSFSAACSGTVPAGMGVASVGAVTVTGPAVAAGYLLATTGANTVRVLRPCAFSGAFLFYIPTTGDKQGAVGIGGTTWWWPGASASDRLSAALSYLFTAQTDIVFSQRAALATSTTFNVTGYLIPTD